MDRNERQKQCFLNWRNNGGKGTLVAGTGFGKTRVATNTMKAFRSVNKEFKVIVIVPTIPLKDQWTEILVFNKLLTNTKVMVINTAIMSKYKCDLLIIDECHGVASDEYIEIFNKTTYKYVLGLTATYERIDGKHELLKKYIPIIDTVSLSECLKNKWIADYTEYKVMVNVDVLEYQEWKKSLLNSLSFFNNDLYLALAMVDPKQIGKKVKFMKDYGYTSKDVIIPAMNVTRNLKKMNTFVMEHPKKVEIANRILDARKDKKCLTFSQRGITANAIKCGEVIHTKLSKKKRAEIIERFSQMTHGTLNSVRVLDEGADIPGVNLSIILCNSSGKRQKVQRIGRSVRTDNDASKHTEVFSLVLRGTSEENWFKNSNSNKKFIEIEEEDLDLILENKEKIEVNKYSFLTLF